MGSVLSRKKYYSVEKNKKTQQFLQSFIEWEDLLDPKNKGMILISNNIVCDTVVD